MADHEGNGYIPGNEVNFVFGNGESGTVAFFAGEAGKLTVRRTIQAAPEPAKRVASDENYFTDVLEPMGFGD